MAIRRLSTASISTGTKSNKMWDQDTAQGAMEVIASSTRTSAGDFDFTNIPQTYQHLFLSVSGRATIAATETGIYIGFNTEYGGNSNYSFTWLQSDGASASSARQSSQPFVAGDGRVPAINATAGPIGQMLITIPNYSSSTIFKNYLLKSHDDRNGSGNAITSIGVWRNTQAISRMYITFGGSMTSGTTATLYGIKAGA